MNTKKNAAGDERFSAISNVFTAFMKRPRSIRFLLVVLALNIIFSLLFIADSEYFLLANFISGPLAVALKLLLNVISGSVLFIAIWNRYRWAWKYGVVYFGFFMVNGLISALAFVLILPKYLEYMLLSIALIALISTALNIIFIAILFKQRDYLESK